MSQRFVKFGHILFLRVILIFCVSLPAPVICQSIGPVAPAGYETRSTAIFDIRTQAADHETPNDKSKKASFISKEFEPLLLLLFGLFLFTVATCIKVRLSRANPVISQYFDPFVSGSADQSGTRS